MNLTLDFKQPLNTLAVDKAGELCVPRTKMWIRPENCVADPQSELKNTIRSKCTEWVYQNLVKYKE